ncbi:hypothetical protein N333_06650, partial [Nestor notabilis]
GITLLPLAESWFDFSSITRAILTGIGIVLTGERSCEPDVSPVLFSESPLSPPPSRYPFPLKGTRSCVS